MTLSKLNKRIKKKVYAVIFEDDTPHHIALCFSIGLFFGFIPLFGLQFLPLLLLIFLFKMNKAATLVGHFLLNTFTFPITYAFSFIVGTQILGEGIGTFLNVKSITWDYLISVYKPLFVGCMIVGLITSIISYFMVKETVYSFRKKYSNKGQKKGTKGTGKNRSKKSEK